MLSRSPHGPACLLERLPETVPGILSYCPLSGLVEFGASVIHRINKKTGNPLKQQNVDAETGSPVDREDIVRGYEIGKGQYLQVEDDELEKIEIESTRRR